MKHIARTVFAVTLATAAGSAMADFPSSVNESSFLSDSFPNVTTYADLHKNDVVKAPSASWPSENETTLLSDSFPNVTTYADLHKDDSLRQAGTPSSSHDM